MKISKFNQSTQRWVFRISEAGSRWAVEAANPWAKRFEAVTTFSTRELAENAKKFWESRLT